VTTSGGGGRLPPLAAACIRLYDELVASQALTPRVVVVYLAPLGAVTGLDVWLSKVALRHLPVAAYTVTKASSLIFTYLLSLALALQVPSWRVGAAVAGVLVGIVLANLRTTAVDAVGLAATLVAAACSAARWVISERYFARRGVTPNVLALIVLQAPLALMCIAPLWVHEVATQPPLASADDMLVFVALALGGGCLAFLLILVELALVHMTSALTMNVIGHAKDVLAIVVAVGALHEPVSAVNLAGTGLALAAMAAYTFLKTRRPAGASRLHTALPASSEDADAAAGGGGDGSGGGDDVNSSTPPCAADGDEAAVRLSPNYAAGSNGGGGISRFADIDDAGTGESRPMLSTPSIDVRVDGGPPTIHSTGSSNSVRHEAATGDCRRRVALSHSGSVEPPLDDAPATSAVAALAGTLGAAGGPPPSPPQP